MTEIELLARFNEAEDTVFGVEPGSIHRFVFHYAEVQAIRAALAALKGAEGDRDRARLDFAAAMRESLTAVAEMRTRAEKAEAERDAAVAALGNAPILSKYHGQTGFELFRFCDDYETWRITARAALASNSGGGA